MTLLDKSYFILSVCLSGLSVVGEHDYEWVQLRPRSWFHLDELFAGACDGMTYEEIEEKFPGNNSDYYVDDIYLAMSSCHYIHTSFIYSCIGFLFMMIDVYLSVC